VELVQIRPSLQNFSVFFCGLTYRFFFGIIPIAITAIGKESVMSKESVRVRKLEEALAKVGPMLPGGISEQWNVCGKQGCACKNPDNPRKHGPYFQLSFTIGGKSSSMFLRRGELAAARRYVRNYARFKALTQQLLQARVDWARKGGLVRGQK
jgi:hypothetical protein